MEERTVTHSTFVLERVYPAPVERVFASFSDPAKKRRWYADNRGKGVETFEMDFRVGGRERTAYRLGDDTPIPGALITNETVYNDIVPNRRIIVSYTMDLDNRRISASLATIEFFAADGGGTNLIFTEQGAYLEGSGGPAIREQGWSGLLDLLGARLKE